MASPTTLQLRHPPLSEKFYKGLAAKAEGKNIWSTLRDTEQALYPPLWPRIMAAIEHIFQNFGE